MKKLLFFDQLPDVRDMGFAVEKWQLERVGSISEVLNHAFFCLPPESPDVFVVRAGSPVSELSMFLRYLRKHRPKLPFVLIMHDDRHVEGWRTLLKGTDITLLKRTCASGYLDHFTDHLSNTLGKYTRHDFEHWPD